MPLSPNSPDTTGQPASRAPRFSHRSRSHDSAHAENPTDSATAAVDHPLVPRGPGELITSQDNLIALLKHLREMGSFAYDSEFIGELTYLPKLCLIQVASSKRVALIDPLAGLDLAPFWELLSDAAVEKIVHAGQQDVEPVFRHAGRAPQNLFDTQIAAGFLGLNYPLALSRLVMEFVGARLGKGLTFTHWDQRPLSAMQLRYAADDVRYLPAAREVMRERLRALGCEQWATEESASLCDPALYEFDPESQYLRLRGASSLTPRGLAILRELCIWRDAAARTENLPPRSMLRDEILIDMARSPVKTADKLAGVRGLPRPVEAKYGQAIVDGTLRAIGLAAEDLPEVRGGEISPTEKFRADALFAAAQCLCAGRGIDPALVFSRQELGEFYRRFLSGKDFSNLRLMTGWRRLAAGQPLVDLLEGKGKLQTEWSEGTLHTMTSNGDGLE